MRPLPRVGRLLLLPRFCGCPRKLAVPPGGEQSRKRADTDRRSFVVDPSVTAWPLAIRQRRGGPRDWKVYPGRNLHAPFHANWFQTFLPPRRDESTLTGRSFRFSRVEVKWSVKWLYERREVSHHFVYASIYYSVICDIDVIFRITCNININHLYNIRKIILMYNLQFY